MPNRGLLLGALTVLDRSRVVNRSSGSP